MNFHKVSVLTLNSTWALRYDHLKITFFVFSLNANVSKYSGLNRPSKNTAYLKDEKMQCIESFNLFSKEIDK